MSLEFSEQTQQLSVPLLPFSAFLPSRILKEINHVLQLHAALKDIWGQQKEMPQGVVVLHLGDER